jgi:hypothetical protein
MHIIYNREFENTAITSGFISAQEKRTAGNIISAKVRFLAALVKRDKIWQLVDPQSTSFKPRGKWTSRLAVDLVAELPAHACNIVHQPR